MSVIDDLIYDRTQEDVDRVKELKEKILTAGLSSLTSDERSEYMAGMKGAYNASDLNRVGQAVRYIASNIRAKQLNLANYRLDKNVASDTPFDCFYPVKVLISGEPGWGENIPLQSYPTTYMVIGKQSWTISNVPSKEQIVDYLADLVLLRQLLPVPEDAPEVPVDLDGLTYVTANKIEYLLFLCWQAAIEIELDDFEARINRAADAFMYAAEAYCGE